MEVLKSQVWWFTTPPGSLPRGLRYSVSRPARHTDATGLIVQIAIVESFSLSQLPSYTKSTNIFESVQGSDSKV